MDGREGGRGGDRDGDVAGAGGDSGDGDSGKRLMTVISYLQFQ